MKDKSFTQALQSLLRNKKLKMMLKTMKTKNNKLNKSPVIEKKSLMKREKKKNEWMLNRKTQRSNPNLYKEERISWMLKRVKMKEKLRCLQLTENVVKKRIEISNIKKLQRWMYNKLEQKVIQIKMMKKRKIKTINHMPMAPFMQPKKKFSLNRMKMSHKRCLLSKVILRKRLLISMKEKARVFHMMNDH